ncbi:MAG: biotin/lipoate A/B protein ligase family protein [Lentisphaeria bacterium]|nr:biotin/lipoate A/B protein ligase family protein [Lentisphaeria bacterium]
MFTVSDFSDTNPFANLAMEEWLTRARADGVRRLLLYRNTAAVVIGRNQNPWCECDPGALRERGVPFVRRMSGGGTVYHDPGNVNYAFILPREDYCPEKYVGIICQALRAAGVPAEQNARHDIMLAGKKISGTAYMLSSRTALHHGTLLVDADLDRLRHALRRPGYVEIETRAIPSVRAAVANIRDQAPDFSVADFKQALMDILGDDAQDRPMNTCPDELPEAVRALMRDRLTPEWIFGRTPPFTATVKPTGKPAWRFSAKKGVVTAVDISGRAWLRPDTPVSELVDIFF